MYMFFVGFVSGSVFGLILMALLVAKRYDPNTILPNTNSDSCYDCVCRYTMLTRLDDIKTEDLHIDEYQYLAARTINLANTPDENERHALHGISSETGEIHDIYQKRYQGHKFDEAHLKKEIGDLMWCISELCVVRGFKLSDICRLNIEKLKARYPDGFEIEKSLNRSEGDI